MRNKKLVPYATIIAAKDGDPEAMNKILAYYNSFIDFHSQRTLYDKYGHAHTVIDSDIKYRICTKIMDKIIYNFDPYRLPSGETLDE